MLDKERTEISMATPHLSPIVDTGSLVFLSGQIAFDSDGAITGDAAAQTRRCLERLEAVLHDAGLSLTDVVKCTIWLRHESDFPAFNEAYASYFGAHKPARSTVISGLALPDALVEIEAIASRTPAER
jgi:2-iminobutanoate/2-iminopropanoate deaminase